MGDNELDGGEVLKEVALDHLHKEGRVAVDVVGACAMEVGVAGHAGLFSNLNDMTIYMESWMNNLETIGLQNQARTVTHYFQSFNASFSSLVSYNQMISGSVAVFL